MKPEVWVVWPTVHLDKSRKLIEEWQKLGYKTALLVNPPLTNEHFIEADMVIVQKKWEGFPVAANILCKNVPGNIVVTIGDDIKPDPDHTAEEIGADFLKDFPNTFGVMQPIGDEFGWTHKCAVSPWIGRKFIEEAYGGAGPYREEYFHYFCDQELQEYAIKMRAFKQRKDLTQFHDHWQRAEHPTRPGHLIQAKTKWPKDKQVYTNRQKRGFPNGTD